MKTFSSSRFYGNDAVAVWKRAASPLNLGRANVLQMIKPGICRLLTSCEWGVGAPQCRNAHQAKLPITRNNAPGPNVFASGCALPAACCRSLGAGGGSAGQC